MTELAEYHRMAHELPAVAIDLPPIPEALTAELKLNRRQGGFAWDPTGWNRWLPFEGVAAMLDELGPLVDRAGVTEVVRRHYRDRPELAYIAVMVWGYGKAGYGPFRTYRQLTGETKPGQGVSDLARRSLRVSAAAVIEQGPEAAYYLLNNRPTKIPHLGSAFFTKWLSFVAETDKKRAGTVPILDALVRRWIVEATGLTLRLDRTNYYGAYLQLLDHWGQGALSRVRLEEAIFRLARPEAQGVVQEKR